MKPHSNTIRRLLVDFVVQEWIDNVATSFSPPEKVDATDHLLNLTLKELHSIKDRDGSSDEFVDAVARGHYGPFEVRVVDAVRAYFAVSQLGEITQKMLDAAKAGELPAFDTKLPKADRKHLLQSWKLTYGAYALLFACEAENITDAIEQCQNANPGEVIIGAFRAPTACLGQRPSLEQVDHVREMVTRQTAQAAVALA